MNISIVSGAIWILVQCTITGAAWSQVLTHGPVVGGVTAESANVFVRSDRAASVALRYGTDPTLATYLTSATFHVDALSNFSKIIPIAGLSAESTYYLNPVVNGVPQLASPYPSFQTFPRSHARRNFSFIVLTDFTNTKDLIGPTQTFASAAAENPAFAFIGGDFDHRNPTGLLGKRQMFKDLYNANTPFMGDFVNLILRKMPIVHQWDDHDAGENGIDRTYPNWSLSQRIFEEWVPSYPLSLVKPGIWQQFSYAQADCFVLDCRSHRDPETEPDDGNKSMLDGNNLGATGQLQQLENALLASKAKWKIIFTSVVTNPTTKFPDGWAGYQTEWNALKDFINTNSIGGIVFISGDLHLGAIDDGTASGFPEMTVSQANGIGGCPTGPYGTWSEGYYQDPTCKGYGVVRISTNPDQLILEVADEFGTSKISYTLLPHPTRPSSR